MISFKNKSVLVTGGSRGIGASTVTLFAKLGANVAYNYQSNKTAADKQLQNIRKYPGNHFSEACDISNFEQVKKFVSHVIDKLTTIDILVNNAGIWEYGAIEKLTVAEWHHTININLNSVFYFT